MVDYKKIGAVAASGVVVFGLGAFSGSLAFPQTVVEEKVVNRTVEVPVPVEVPVVEYVNQTVEVPVDNGNLDLVLNYIYEEGLSELDLNDLDDDEVDRIVDRIAFLNESNALAREYVRFEFLDVIDNEYVNGDKIDEDDVERVRVGEVEDFTFSNVDFDYDDAVVSVPVEFEHNGNDYNVTIDVTIRNAEVDGAELQ